MSENVKAIYPAMGKIMSEISAIGKNKTVTQGMQFKYRGIDDMYNELHGLFKKHQVIIVPETCDHSLDVINTVKENKYGKKESTTRHHLTMEKYHFVSCVDGSSITTTVKSEAACNADKGLAKSQSAGLKYMLLRMFLIPTEDLKDIDPDQFNNPLPANQKPPANRQQNQLDVYRANLLKALKDKQIQLGTIEEKVGKSLADFVKDDYKTASQVIQRIGLINELVTRLGARGMTVQTLEAEHGSYKDWSNEKIKELINHLKGE